MEFSTKKLFTQKASALYLGQRISGLCFFSMGLLCQNSLAAVSRSQTSGDLSEKSSLVTRSFFSEKMEEQVSIDLSSWTIEQKIGQLLMIGYRSKEQVERVKPSGLVFFSWSLKNPSQTEKLLSTVKNYNSIKTVPFFLATDHEGGRVLRLRKGLTPFPDAAAVGSLGKPELAFQVGKSMGLELASLGFNMNLAPVLDLGNARSFLANRVWGEDPHRVSDMTLGFVQGLYSSRILSVGKHFPGHGGTSEDSHFSLPVISKSESKLWEQDLVPFKNAVDKGISAVMTAHVEIPSVDKGPASLSYKFITEILKEKIGFKGLVITDDLEMGGVAKVLGYAPHDLALKALKAGSDLILIVWSEDLQNNVVGRLKKALADGEISEEWLDEKVKKIVSFKKKFLGDVENENPYWKENLRKPASLKLSQAVTQNAIQWMGGNELALLSGLNAHQGSKWKVFMPSRSWTKFWKTSRNQDDVTLLPRVPNSLFVAQVKKELRASIQNSQPLLIVTPPRALGSEEIFSALRVELAMIAKSSQIRSPIIWAHQGATPIRIKWSPEKLPMGILSLHSGSLDSLKALMNKLITQKSSVSAYHFSEDAALMEAQ